MKGSPLGRSTSMPAPLTIEEMEYYDMNAPLLGFMGAAFALIFSNLGAAYGTGKSGMGISALGVGKPELVMKSIVPVCAASGWCPSRQISLVMADKDSQCLSSARARDAAPVQVVMAGVLGIYGLIIAVIIANAVSGVEQGRPAYGMLYAPGHAHPRPPSPWLPILPMRARVPLPSAPTTLARDPANRRASRSARPQLGDGALRWRARVRVERPRGWPGDRHCRRHVHASGGGAAQTLCWHGAHPHLRRGARLVRTHRRPDPRLQGVSIDSISVNQSLLDPLSRSSSSLVGSPA